MRKFKLIKEYPDSLPLNTEVVFGNHGLTGDSYQVKLDKIYRISPENIENHSEFWQEIFEKDYEILSFMDNLNIITNNLGGQHEKNCLNNKHFNIHSVKRLSDGEVFTIGDKTCTPGNIYPIAEFTISDTENTILVSSYYENSRSGSYNIRLKNVIKSKKPLFITEDGVDIFEGDYFCRVGRPNSGHAFQCWDGDRNNKATPVYSHVSMNEYNYHFSSVKVANDFIIFNKPCLSINDITYGLNSSYITSNMLQELIQKVQEKISWK